MFKFTDRDSSEVWIDPKSIGAIEHYRDDELGQHYVAIYMSNRDMAFEYRPTSEENCRTFLFNLFKAMGEEYKYE